MVTAESSIRSHQIERHRRIWLGMLVVSWGIQAIVTQSLLMREALVLNFGSEIAWGIVLFAWLLGVAVGASVGGRTVERLRNAPTSLVILLLILSAAACVDLWLFRGARGWLGVEPGEMLPLPKTVLAALLLVSPVGAFVGAAFPIACSVGIRSALRVAQHDSPPVVPKETPRSTEPIAHGHLQFGTIYALESGGGLIGGAAFSFWAVEHLSPIQTSLCCAALVATASAGFLQAYSHRRMTIACLAATAVVMLAAAFLTGDTLDQLLIQRRWANVAPGYKQCIEVESKYQNLAIGRRAQQYTLYTDGKVSADFPDPYTYVPLAHFWLCQHPSPRKVLVLGGGAEGLLAEILQHPVDRIDYVEPDPRQIELIEPFLTDADREALNDPRVAIHSIDARHFVKTQKDRFDLVIAHLPQPTSALRARLYTEEFYRELRRSMTERSVLCLTAAATPGSLPADFADYLASIRETLRQHFPCITVGWGNPAHVLAATVEGLISTDSATLRERYTLRGVNSHTFDPDWFDGATDWLAEDKLALRKQELDTAANVEISTDLRPAVYMQRLALWESAMGSAGVTAGHTIKMIRAVRVVDLIGTLALFAAVTVLAYWLRARFEVQAKSGVDASKQALWFPRSAIVLSLATTGFATMALSIIWLFAFQNLYGYVYQRIGWIIALFMGGLVVGCELINRKLRKPTRMGDLRSWVWRRLILVDILLALLAGTIPFVLPALANLQHTDAALVIVEWCVSIMVALTGTLGGAAFALGGRLQLEATGRAGRSAGTIVSADHAGACLGALLCGIVLVPVFGTATAAFLLVGIKLGSAVLLVAGRRATTLQHG